MQLSCCLCNVCNALIYSSSTGIHSWTGLIWCLYPQFAWRSMLQLTRIRIVRSILSPKVPFQTSLVIFLKVYYLGSSVKTTSILKCSVYIKLKDSWLRAFLWCMSQTSRDRVNSRRVRTHEKNSGDAVRRLGTIIQSIFWAQSGANIRLTVCCCCFFKDGG